MAVLYVKVVVQFNRVDEAGWSETYYVQALTSNTARVLFAPVLAARRALLSAYCYVFAVRYTQVSFPPTRTSLLDIQNTPNVNPSGLGTGIGNLDPDVGTVGALGKFGLASGATASRLLRGLPDSGVNFSPSTYRMSLGSLLLGQLNNFALALTAQSNLTGWIPRGAVNGGNTKTSPILTAVQLSSSQLAITFNPATSYVPLTDGTIILSGFRGQAAPLNGAYGYHQWSSPTAGTILVNKAFPGNAASSYEGQGGFVRVQLNAFSQYVPLANWVGSLVRTRNIGNPFGRTRGRRRARA